MRIGLISHTYLEEAYRYVLDELAQFPNVELALYTPDRYRLALQNSTGTLGEPSKYYKTYAIPIRWSGRQGTFHYRVGALVAALEDFQPQVLLHEQEVFALGAFQIAFLATRRRIPLAMFVNENIHRKLAMPRRWLRGYVMNRCDGLVAVSQLAAQVHRDWGFKGPITTLAQIGVQLGIQPPLGYRSPNDGLQICYAGRIEPEKGIDCLVRALGALRSMRVNFRCTIAGRGNQREALNLLANELELGTHVDFVGNLRPHALTELFRHSDVLVLPSRKTPVWEEQLGRVLLEAMAQGTVPVGSRTGAIPEVIGSNELIFEENQHDALAEILARLAADETLLRKHQKRIWHRVHDEYELGVVTSRKVDFLHGLVQKQRKHPDGLSSRLTFK